LRSKDVDTFKVSERNGEMTLGTEDVFVFNQFPKRSERESKRRKQNAPRRKP
jgi:hypothetical protein